MDTKIVADGIGSNVAEDAGRTFDLLHKAGYAVEMRVFGQRKGDIASGYYDSRDAFVGDTVEQDSTGIDTCYVTLNPVHADLLARSYNTLNRCDGTADKNVERFRVLLLDFDPKKVSGVPSTDAEMGIAEGSLPQRVPQRWGDGSNVEWCCDREGKRAGSRSRWDKPTQQLLARLGHVGTLLIVYSGESLASGSEPVSA